MTKVLGIAGYARCGKDTFVGIAKEILTKNGYHPVRVAFADSLKQEVTEMLKVNNFKTSVYTEEIEEKKLIRPLLVWWGCQRRYESPDGLHWVNVAEKKIRYYIEDIKIDPEKIIFLVSDVRFLNESRWIHNSFNGEVIHLKRFSIKECRAGQDGSDVGFSKIYDPGPNDEELKNDPLVQEVADHRIEWESKKKMTSAEAIADVNLQKVVLETLNSTKYFRHPSPIIGKLSQ